MSKIVFKKPIPTNSTLMPAANFEALKIDGLNHVCLQHEQYTLITELFSRSDQWFLFFIFNSRS